MKGDQTGTLQMLNKSNQVPGMENYDCSSPSWIEVDAECKTLQCSPILKRYDMLKGEVDMLAGLCLKGWYIENMPMTWRSWTSIITWVDIRIPFVPMRFSSFLRCSTRCLANKRSKLHTALDRQSASLLMTSIDLAWTGHPRNTL